MKKDMKSIKLMALLCVMGVCFASCEKTPKSEWRNYYGYTAEDIIGTYAFSNVSGAFDSVEGIGRHACPDAEISIAPYSANKVEFKINCPSANFSKTIEGKTTPNENDFMIRMSTGYIHSGGKIKAYNVDAHVFTNDKNEIRLHGHIAENIYHIVENSTGGQVYVQDDGVYYYFDVIKN